MRPAAGVHTCREWFAQGGPLVTPEVAGGASAVLSPAEFGAQFGHQLAGGRVLKLEVPRVAHRRQQKVVGQKRLI